MANYYINGYADQKTRVEINRNLFPVKKESWIKQILKIASQYGRAMEEDDAVSAKDRCNELHTCVEEFDKVADRRENIRLAMYIATTTNRDARELLLNVLTKQLYFNVRKKDYDLIQEILAKQKDKNLAIKVDKFFTKYFDTYKKYKTENSTKQIVKR